MKKKSEKLQSAEWRRKMSGLKSFLPLFFSIFISISVSDSAAETRIPRVAVTDLSYEERVQQFVEYSEVNRKWDNRSSMNERARNSERSDSSSFNDRSHEKGELAVKTGSGLVTVISRGEFRKFVGDIKGELIKSGTVRIVQAKPWTDAKNDTLYDIIDRIKKGYFPGADYVLFGTVTAIDWRDEANPLQGSNAISLMGALELVAEFSLINTRTFEVTAAFSALGEGSETRLVNSGLAKVSLSRPKIMQQVSRSLGVAVVGEIQSQIGSDAR